MANTITLTPQHAIAGVKFMQIGLVPFSVLTTETYATPTGITIDFDTQVDLLNIPFADVIGAIGWSTAGHLAIFTKTSTDSQFTVRLWNGTTEASDGALNNTIVGYLIVSAQGK